MTARRQNTAQNAFAVAMQRKTESAKIEQQNKISKFTALLNLEDANTFDHICLGVRRKIGRRVHKVDILRVLISLSADDQTLLNQIAEELRDQQID